MPQARGTRTTDSMQESLKGMLADIAYMKTMPDADLQYLGALENSVLARLRAPVAQALATAQQAGAILPQNLQQTAAQAMGGMGGPMGQMGGMGGGLGPMGGQLASPPNPAIMGRGISSFPSMPPVDELRRMLTR